MGVGVLAAVLGLAGLTWLAWALLHHPKVSHTGVISLHEAVGVLQLFGAIVKTCGSRDRLSGFLLVLFAGPFDEFSVGDRRSGADQGDEMRRVDRAPAVLG